jgi:hypothetical protein
MAETETGRVERTLWCLHTIGPDDINAAPDFDTAVAWAEYHNRQTEAYTVMRGMQNDPHWPFVRSVVAIWPGTPEAHAESLPDSIAQCSPPVPATPAPDSEKLREAATAAEDSMREMFRYFDGGETRGSYDGRPERDGLRRAWYKLRAALGASA